MPRVSLYSCLREFDQNIQNTLLLFYDVKTYVIRHPSGAYHRIGARKVELFAGLALLKICLAWEDFLEGVFLRYMCGGRSPGGFTPSLTRNPEPTISSAMTRLLGPNQVYLNWNVQKTLTRANQYFDQGEPFSSGIRAIRGTLEDMGNVRNRFAHRSSFAIQKFRDIIFRTFGYLPRGMNPGRYLMTLNPTQAASRQTFVEFYASTLVASSSLIVP